MKPILAFDMNGTLLDMRSLDAHFEAVFEREHVRREWFLQLIQLAMAAAITERFQDFGTLARVALETCAARRGIELDEDAAQRILGAVRTMPALADVAPGLDRLARHGFRLVVLTNALKSVAEATLEHAGIRAYFEAVLSVESVQTYKPDARVYRMAARACGVEVQQVMLIAAHSWDVTGAMRAGLRAAFIARRDEALDSNAPRPDHHVRDVMELADQLLREHARG